MRYAESRCYELRSTVAYKQPINVLFDARVHRCLCVVWRVRVHRHRQRLAARALRLERAWYIPCMVYPVSDGYYIWILYMDTVYGYVWIYICLWIRTLDVNGIYPVSGDTYQPIKINK